MDAVLSRRRDPAGAAPGVRGRDRGRGGPLREVEPIPLAELPVGGWGRVCPSVAGTAIGLRLLALGFVPGTRIGMIRRAPFGGPVELELRGYRICLRLRQLDGLRILPEPAGEAG